MSKLHSVMSNKKLLFHDRIPCVYISSFNSLSYVNKNS
jgi:hypothetical protein